jgi:hypothetical protein
LKKSVYTFGDTVRLVGTDWVQIYRV